MTALTTPSPYLRDGLLDLAAGLRQHAEAAAKWCIETDAEVERARKRLADAERLAERAGREYGSLIRDANWVEREAARLTARIDAAPAEALAATGLMPPGADPMDVPQGDPFHPAVDPFDSPCVRGEHARCAGCSECPQNCHPDAPPAPGTPPSDPDQPGTVVAVSGPTVTQPDPGAAHPVPNPPIPWPEPAPAPPPPAAGGEPRHAKPRQPIDFSGAFKAITGRLAVDEPTPAEQPTDEQTGDQTA
ncbi:hypothetical protein [Actinomadura luteofluorescens]|uniref:hypothetical protein n=1 Tax=Actinomadura luteofluorescens TaxID=46163 RepID=UPI003D936A43